MRSFPRFTLCYSTVLSISLGVRISKVRSDVREARATLLSVLINTNTDSSNAFPPFLPPFCPSVVLNLHAWMDGRRGREAPEGSGIPNADKRPQPKKGRVCSVRVYSRAHQKNLSLVRSWKSVEDSAQRLGVAADRSAGEKAIQVYNPSIAALNRARSALATAQRTDVSWLLQEFSAQLENFCPLQGTIPVPEQRSPLPVWWPRKPLQDITQVLNSHPEASGDLVEKNEKKKSQPCWSLGKENTSRRLTRISNMSASSSNCNRGSLLRKGFR
ncbi:hypothetical protein R1flu_010592 [Riccia fluitans]|uniref:Uncharacterized protein n=1 Tax=Riccia fluitans TaxID=41844 RepID=A0ABD1Z5E8_9MARC